MSALNQKPLFMIREGDGLLDRTLAEAGYGRVDPTMIYICPVSSLTSEPSPTLSGFTIWPPLAIMKDLWAAGGIGPLRVAVMERVTGPKTAILARGSDRVAGCSFVGIHENIAMIHAIEVAPSLRRTGVGNQILRHAAHWAQNMGADYFSLAVTDANTAAKSLYSKLGMSVAASYHYRQR